LNVQLSQHTVRLIKVPVFLACLVPLGALMWRSFEIGGATLGANPIETLLHNNGLWGLRFLLITLTITPLRRLTGWSWLQRFRRMFGLFAFFYICLHFIIYAVLDQGLALDAIIEDVVERPYITLGMAGLLLLIPLAATSTAGMMRRLGRRWTQLHRLVYVIAILGCWHFWWQVKQDILEPLIYAAILAVLLGFRFVVSRQKAARSRNTATASDP